ncbi:MAG: MFS transporter [Verrucomicrobiota bacterium JB022]|nr:MFS transporter [Verrucomicrobiota bacterium JB022]
MRASASRRRPSAPLGSLRANLTNCIIEGTFATPWVFLALPGNFLLSMLLVDRFGLDKATYGWIASLPFWANFLQVFIVPFLARYLTGRDLAVNMAWFNVGLWLTFVGFLPYVPTEDPGAVRELMLFFFTGICITASLVTVGWTAWTRDWVPTPLQSRYFGVRNRWINAATVAYLVLVAALAYDAEGSSIRHFQWLIGIGVVARLGSALWNNTIRTPGKDGELSRAHFWQNLRLLKGEKAFWRFVIFAAWVGFWISFISPFVPLYVYRHLDGTVFLMATLTILSTLMGAIAMPHVGRLVERHGARPVIMLSLVAWKGMDYTWLFLNPGNRWILYPLWCWGGTVSVGYLLGIFLLLMKLVPRHAKSAAISIHLAITSLGTAMGPVAAGWFLSQGQNWGLDEATLFRIGFALSFTFTIASILILRPVQEPNVKGEASMLGTMRSLRQLMLYTGMGAFLNTNLSRRHGR